MTKRAKPVMHARDHEHGGADPTRIHYEDVGTSGGGSAAGLFEIVGAIGFGENLYDNPDSSSDWIAWQDGYWSFSDSGSGPVIHPDPANHDYVMFPNTANAVWRIELMLYVDADPQTEPITTPKRWTVGFYLYEGGSGSWSSFGTATPGLTNTGMVFQHNLENFDAIPNSLFNNQVMWARFYTWRVSATASLALRVKADQTHPTGSSLADRQTNLSANVMVAQV